MSLTFAPAVISYLMAQKHIIAGHFGWGEGLMVHPLTDYVVMVFRTQGSVELSDQQSGLQMAIPKFSRFLRNCLLSTKVRSDAQVLCSSADNQFTAPDDFGIDNQLRPLDWLRNCDNCPSFVDILSRS